MGVPLVVAGTRVDRHYFDERLLRFFEPGDAADLARTIVAAWRDREGTAARAAEALRFAVGNDWAIRRKVYLDVVARLTGG